MTLMYFLNFSLFIWNIWIILRNRNTAFSRFAQETEKNDFLKRVFFKSCNRWCHIFTGRSCSAQLTKHLIFIDIECETRHTVLHNWILIGFRLYLFTKVWIQEVCALVFIWLSSCFCQKKRLLTKMMKITSEQNSHYCQHAFSFPARQIWRL